MTVEQASVIILVYSQNSVYADFPSIPGELMEEAREVLSAECSKITDEFHARKFDEKQETSINLYP